jgi:hypothetical protein
MTQQSVQIESRCHTCGLRARAEKRPSSLLAGVWRWHTGWCPGWNAYVKELESKGLQVPDVRTRMDT